MMWLILAALAFAQDGLEPPVPAAAADEQTPAADVAPVPSAPAPLDESDEVPVEEEPEEPAPAEEEPAPVEAEPAPVEAAAPVEIPALAPPAPVPVRTRPAPLSGVPVGPQSMPVSSAQPIVVMPAEISTSGLSQRLLPDVPLRGFRAGLTLLILALAFLLLSVLCGNFRRRLAPAGALPRLLAGAETMFRVLTVLAAILVLAAWAPRSIAPLLPWFLVATALAVGWSARDVLPDVIAWIIMAMEGRVRPGKWVAGDAFRGQVLSVGLRSTVLDDARGNEVSVPNRLILGAPLVADRSNWPAVEVEVALPLDWPASELRQALREAVLLSPWVAPGEMPEITNDTEGAGHWGVRVRLLKGDYAGRFEGSLRERVMEVLADGTASESSQPGLSA